MAEMITANNINQYLIYKVIAGSHAYGLSTPESDTDIRGLCIPPEIYFLSPDLRFEQLELSEPHDTVIYNVQKFIKLAMDCNPSVIELLYIENPEHILYRHDVMDILIGNRDLFLSAKARFTFSGYAYAQLKRMETHRKWLLHPANHKPTRSEFGLSENDVLSGSELGAINKLIRQGDEKYPECDAVNVEELGSDALRMVQKENEYRNALNEWNQYQNWKKTRNPKRSALEAKAGYDCKNASHCIRLLLEGVEILTKGTITVDRSKAGDDCCLRSIRNGEWSYDLLMAQSKSLDDEMKRVYDEKKYVVAHSPDRDKIRKVCVDMMKTFWRDNP